MTRLYLLLIGLLGLRLVAGCHPEPRAPAARHEPIIDVHMHAYPPTAALPETVDPITHKPTGLTNGEDHLRATLAVMNRLNVVTAVVSAGDGDRLAVVEHWRQAAPDRFIAGAGIRGSTEIPLPTVDTLRAGFREGKLRVLGEVTAEYAGLTLSDPIYEPYLALAEELDVPISLHTGIGPPGISFDPCCREFRVRLGNPLLIEDALTRHPKLRVNLMHAGWPYLADTVALMMVYPQVYVDLGAIDWLAPRAEFYAYLGALMRAGMGKRVMFGSDDMYWPEAIGMAVEAIDAAPFLTPDDRHDIFFANAKRFFRIP